MDSVLEALPAAPTHEPDQPAAGGGPVGEGDYVCKQGDCISSIAADYGHFWQTIWDHPGNARLKAVRQEPNALFPGDRVTVPPITPKTETRPTDQRHRFVKRGDPSILRLRVLDYDGPRRNETYELIVDGSIRSGTTDGDGNLEVGIPGNARRAKLILPSDGTIYDLNLGGVDPIMEVSGVQGRLTNLGYDCGPADNVLGPRTREALRQFQKAMGLTRTGEPDQATCSKLQQEHGS
jgi:hypothetical protein